MRPVLPGNAVTCYSRPDDLGYDPFGPARVAREDVATSAKHDPLVLNTPGQRERITGG